HGPAFPDAEQRVLVRIPQNRHDQLIENIAAALDQIQMTVSGRIERAGVDGNYLFQCPSCL
ncbi:MAG: hypothetical protein QOD84_310, partial [Acidobacteriaceae bacterium]